MRAEPVKSWPILVVVALLAGVVSVGVASAVFSLSSGPSASPAGGAEPTADVNPAGPVAGELDLSTVDPSAATTVDELDSAIFSEGMTPLSDCPEALEFFGQPDVVEFYEKHYGHAPDGQDTWAGGCPDVDVLKRDYGQTLARKSG